MILFTFIISTERKKHKVNTLSRQWKATGNSNINVPSYPLMNHLKFFIVMNEFIIWMIKFELLCRIQIQIINDSNMECAIHISNKGVCKEPDFFNTSYYQ